MDIHDGENVGLGEDEKVAAHLHQSDLLVLDFQLNGSNSYGTKATEIARSVMNNGHVNLVVVHTAADSNVAFPKMLLGLISPRVDLYNEVDRAAFSTACMFLTNELRRVERRLPRSMAISVIPMRAGPAACLLLHRRTTRRRIL